jgi:type IV secretion system protein VirB6
MFNSWLQLIFSSCLIFLFCGLAIKAGMTFLNGILTISIANADELNLISTGAQAGVAGAFMAWIIWQAKTYASQLAGVGVEGAMQGQPQWGLVLACSALPVWGAICLAWVKMQG